jgi:uncharacterized protein (DUF1778 family)
MPKTITIRLDDKTYKLFKAAANGERRSISNYIENAAFSHLIHEEYVSDEEMKDIYRDKELLKSLSKGLQDIKKKRYRVVR